MARLPPALAFFICVLIWGTTWIAIKIGYQGMDPLWGAGLRFAIAGALLLAIAGARRLAWPRDRTSWAVIGAAGVFIFAIDYGLIYWGEQTLSSGLTSILFATLPLFTMVYAAVLLPQEKVGPRHVAGIIVSGLGLLALFGQDLQTAPHALIPSLAIVLAAAACAIANVIVRRWGRSLHPVTLNAGAMLVGALLLVPASIIAGEAQALPTTAAPWAALLYLAIPGSVIAFILYWDLLKRWPAQRATLLVLLTPIVALATGVIAGEHLTPLEWAASAVTLLGVAVALAPTPRRIAAAGIAEGK